jgi:NIMA (never in mitosis gene a)-related kinase 1/4/5
MNLFIQLALGVQYLHQHKIVHRDIKPQNIFINEDGVLKLADFGISKALDQTQEKAMTLVGTPYYLR